MKNVITGSDKELRILAYVLLAYAVYALASGVYDIIDDYLWPRLFSAASRPVAGLPWPYALVTLFTTALSVTVAGLSYSWIKEKQSRGWWLSGALFAAVIIGSCLGIAQTTLMTVPPDNMPLYTVSPGVLVSNSIWLALGLIMLVYHCRTPLMHALSIETERKGPRVGRLFLYGLLLTLAELALVALITGLIAVFMP